MAVKTSIQVELEIPDGTITITAEPGQNTIGFHWRSFGNIGPYLNCGIDPNNIEDSVIEALDDARVWIDDKRMPEVIPHVVAAAKHAFLSAQKYKV